MHVIAEAEDIQAVQKACQEICYVTLTDDQAREFIETDAMLAAHLLVDKTITLQGGHRLIALVAERVMPHDQYWPWPRDFYPTGWKIHVRDPSPKYARNFVEAFRRSAAAKGFQVSEEFGKEAGFLYQD